MAAAEPSHSSWAESSDADEAPRADDVAQVHDQELQAAVAEAAGPAVGGVDAAHVEVAREGAPTGIPAEAGSNGTPDREPGETGVGGTEAGDVGNLGNGAVGDAGPNESEQHNGASRPRRRRGRRGGRSRRDEAPTADPLADGSDPSDFEPADLSRAEV
jgi:hypothetical protein